MIIGNRNVPNKLIERYCRVIRQLEIQFHTELEYIRTSIHNEIFEYANCERSLYKREDREFNKALNKVVEELT